MRLYIIVIKRVESDQLVKIKIKIFEILIFYT